MLDQQSEQTVKFWHRAFWSPTKAVVRLETGVMSQSERLSYFVAWSLIMVVGYEGSRFMGLAEPWSIELLLTLVGIAGMILPIFYFNHLHATDTSFIEKYVVIYVAATFRVLFFIAIPYIGVTIIVYAALMPDIASDQVTYLDVFNGAGFLVIVAWYLGRFFKIGNNSQLESV